MRSMARGIGGLKKKWLKIFQKAKKKNLKNVMYSMTNANGRIWIIMKNLYKKKLVLLANLNKFGFWYSYELANKNLRAIILNKNQCRLN